MTVFMILELFGGLGLFIYGMHMMSEGLKIVAGNKMKHLLEILTNNRFKAIIVGIVVTIMVQSSSTTTVMLVGFVNAGLMTLSQTAGVILGADIGTTIMAQMIAFNVEAIAPAFIAVGVILALFAKKKSTRDIGQIVLGFGILFFGVSTMSSSMEPLKNSEVFINWMTTYGKNPFLGLLIGTAITAIMQSSGATIGLLQALAISGVFASVTGTDAIAICFPMMIGTNIGTCATALLSSIGTNKNAKNVAYLHLGIKILGAIWIMAVILILDKTFDVNPFYAFLCKISGTMTTVEGQVIPNVARQIAMGHTFFNVANTIVMVPLLDKLVALLERISPPDLPDEDDKGPQLDDLLLNSPAVALGQVEQEVVHMSKMARKNFHRAADALFDSDEKKIKKVFDKEERIDEFEHEIVDYTIRLSNMNISQYQRDMIAFFIKDTHDLERIGDHAENIAQLAQLRLDEKVDFSVDAKAELSDLISFTEETLDALSEVLETRNEALCHAIRERESEIDRRCEELLEKHMLRLNEGSCNAYAGMIYSDLLTNVERVGDHANNIVKDILKFEKDRNVNKIEGVISGM